MVLRKYENIFNYLLPNKPFLKFTLNLKFPSFKIELITKSEFKI